MTGAPPKPHEEQMVLPLRWRAARLQQAIAGKDQEISLLAKKAGRDAH